MSKNKAAFDALSKLAGNTPEPEIKSEFKPESDFPKHPFIDSELSKGYAIPSNIYLWNSTALSIPVGDFNSGMIENDYDNWRRVVDEAYEEKCDELQIEESWKDVFPEIPEIEAYYGEESVCDNIDCDCDSEYDDGIYEDFEYSQHMSKVRSTAYILSIGLLFIVILTMFANHKVPMDSFLIGAFTMICVFAFYFSATFIINQSRGLNLALDEIGELE